MKPYPSQDTLRDFFDYRDGQLYWKKANGPRANLVTPAGSNEKRYRAIKLNSQTYKMHRLIWIMHHGPIPESVMIDHIDGNGFNNGIENLRLATGAINQRNQVNRKQISKSGARGAYLCGNKFVARITVNGVSNYLGTFSSIDLAENAYQRAVNMQLDLLHKELSAKNDALEARLAALES